MNALRIQHIKFTGPLALSVIALPFSITLCNLGVGLLGVSWISDWKWKEKWKALTTNSSVSVFILFFLLHLFAITYSADKPAAWFNVEKKLFLFVLPLILASVKLEKEDIRLLLISFIIACLTGTLICLGVAFSKTTQGLTDFNFDAYGALAYRTMSPQYGNDPWAFFSYIELASGIGIHPAYFSLYLTFCILILIHFYAASFFSYGKLKQAIIFLTVIYLSVFIICLSTRIITIALFLILIYGTFRFLNGISVVTKGATIILFSSLFVGVLYLNPVSRFRNYQEVVSTWPFLQRGLQTQSTTIRASLWSLSIKSLPHINYFLGVGPGDVEHLMQRTGKEYGITNILNTHDPHSQYFYTLLGLGGIGLLTLLCCFILPAIFAFQHQNYFYVMFIVLFALLCLTESALELQKGIAFFCLFNSLFLFQPSCVQRFQFKELRA
jgi:O-antigen ligase